MDANKKQQITHNDFAKLDIRIGTILSAEKVPETDKLLHLEVEVGEEPPRHLVAGIAEYAKDPHALIGKQVPVLLNLEPKVIRGLQSYGMILAISSGDGLALIHPDRVV